MASLDSAGASYSCQVVTTGVSRDIDCFWWISDKHTLLTGESWDLGVKDFDGRAVAKKAAILLAQRQEHALIFYQTWRLLSLDDLIFCQEVS